MFLSAIKQSLTPGKIHRIKYDVKIGLWSLRFVFVVVFKEKTSSCKVYSFFSMRKQAERSLSFSTWRDKTIIFQRLKTKYPAV